MCFLRNYLCANPCENLRNLCNIMRNMDEVRKLSEVTPCLYVSAGCAITDAKLQELGINLIINSTEELDSYEPPKGSNIQVIRIPVKDLSDTELAPYFKATADLIRANEESGGKTLVHCIFGVSRSVTLCMAYLMMYVKSNKVPSAAQNKNAAMGVYEALDYIRTKRCIARPNPGFMTQLVQFEKQIPEIPDVDADSGNAITNTIIDENKFTKSIIQLTKSLRSLTKENVPA